MTTDLTASPSHPVPTPSRTDSANVTVHPVPSPPNPTDGDGVNGRARTPSTDTKPFQDQGRGQVLYRLTDGADRLLYVGITLNPGKRMKRHGETKPWWSEVANIRLEHYPSRAAVLAAEKHAIMAEAPIWNIQHNKSTPIQYSPIADCQIGTLGARLGDCVLLCLNDGRAPIGLIDAMDKYRVELSLFSFITGLFGFRRQIFMWDDVERIEVAPMMTDAEIKREGWRHPEPGVAYFQTRWLGELQADWMTSA